MGRHFFKLALLVAVMSFTSILRVGAEPLGRVVVLHGLGRSSTSMWLLANRLTQAGFEVHNLDYPSTEETIDQLVELLDGELEKNPGSGLHCPQAPPQPGSSGDAQPPESRKPTGR